MRIVVLFNLRPGVDPPTYEAWAASADAPTVRALPSIDGFRVHALTGMLFGDAKSPFQYCEVIDINDMDAFGRDVGTAAMGEIAAKFQTFADNPLFLTTREVGA